MLYGLLARGVAFNPKNDIPDLSGKVFFITGGNVGLGKETALQLSAHSPSRIYLAARTQSKAEKTIKEILEVVPNAPIKFIQCDLTSFKSIRACAQEFVQQEKRLDVLFLNAGIMAVPPGQTEDGYEIQIGTNHIGHALLTKLLLPTLLKTAEQPDADVRVVSVSSIGHTAASGVSFDDLKTNMANHNTWKIYGQSKLCNILFVKELAKRYPSITSVAVHPGMVNTELYNSYITGWGSLGWAATKLKNLACISLQDGAKGQLWAGTAPLAKASDTGVRTGTYYTPVGVAGQGTRVSDDPVLAEKLWEWTEKELESWKL